MTLNPDLPYSDQPETRINQRSELIRFRIGVIGVILSLIIMIPLALVPFLEVSTQTKAIIGTTIFVSSEILYYGGLIIGGPVLFRKIKPYLPVSGIKRFLGRFKSTAA